MTVETFECSGGRRRIEFHDEDGCFVQVVKWGTAIQLEKDEAVEAAIAILERYWSSYQEEHAIHLLRLAPDLLDMANSGYSVERLEEFMSAHELSGKEIEAAINTGRKIVKRTCEAK